MPDTIWLGKGIARLALLAALALPAAHAAGAGGFSAEFLQRIKSRNNLTDALLKAYLPYLHPPVRQPVAEGISLDIPAGLGAKALAAAGIVDVAAAWLGCCRAIAGP